MVKLNQIYTRTGDDGTTGLVRGERRPKFDPRIEAVGVVDEANAAIGLCRTAPGLAEALDATLTRVQNDLFDIGSDLATPGEDAPGAHVLRITPGQADWLETEIDAATDRLEPLRSFILPGGTDLAARFHVARTIVRRAERRVVELRSVEPDVSVHVAVYLNRLSDLLFVLGRLANDGGRADVLWVPGASRKG